MLLAMALVCWGNYEEHHVEMDTINLDGMIQEYDSKTVGPSYLWRWSAARGSSPAGV